jgi:hypothetical protein
MNSFYDATGEFNYNITENFEDETLPSEYPDETTQPTSENQYIINIIKENNDLQENQIGDFNKTISTVKEYIISNMPENADSDNLILNLNLIYINQNKQLENNKRVLYKVEQYLKSK